jgi:hypothetical protein
MYMSQTLHGVWPLAAYRWSDSDLVSVSENPQYVSNRLDDTVVVPITAWHPSYIVGISSTRGIDAIASFGD